MPSKDDGGIANIVSDWLFLPLSLAGCPILTSTNLGLPPRHLGKRDDIAIYFWTSLQYILRHYFNRRIPRLLDDRQALQRRAACWRISAIFTRRWGRGLSQDMIAR